MPSTKTTQMEEALRRLLAASELPPPDEVAHRDDGTLLALWHDRKVAVVVEPDEVAGA